MSRCGAWATTRRSPGVPASRGPPATTSARRSRRSPTRRSIPSASARSWTSRWSSADGRRSWAGCPRAPRPSGSVARSSSTSTGCSTRSASALVRPTAPCAGSTPRGPPRAAMPGWRSPSTGWPQARSTPPARGRRSSSCPTRPPRSTTPPDCPSRPSSPRAPCTPPWPRPACAAGPTSSSTPGTCSTSTGSRWSWPRGRASCTRACCSPSPASRLARAAPRSCPSTTRSATCSPPSTPACVRCSPGWGSRPSPATSAASCSRPSSSGRPSCPLLPGGRGLAGAPRGGRPRRRPARSGSRRRGRSRPPSGPIGSPTRASPASAATASFTCTAPPMRRRSPRSQRPTTRRRASTRPSAPTATRSGATPRWSGTASGCGGPGARRRFPSRRSRTRARSPAGSSCRR